MPRDYYSSQEQNEQQGYSERSQERQGQYRSRRYASQSREEQGYQPRYSRVQRTEERNASNEYAPARQSRYAPAPARRQQPAQSRRGYPSRTENEQHWEGNQCSRYGNDYEEDIQQQPYDDQPQEQQYEDPEQEQQYEEEPMEMEKPRKERSWPKYLAGAAGGGLLVAIVWIVFYMHESGMLPF